jgi:DNA-binding transcriptional ArsR family regulator
VRSLRRTFVHLLSQPAPSTATTTHEVDHSTDALVTTNVFPVTDPLTAAAEPNRRRILQLLASQPRTVTEIAAEFPVTRSAISQHLLVLAEAGLVEAEKDGRQRIYRVLPSGLRKLQAEIDKFWTSELDQLVADAQALRRDT